MKKPKDIFMDKAHIELAYRDNPQEIVYENNVLVKAGININGHFGNIVSLDLRFTNSSICGCHNNTSNIGHMIKACIEVLSKTDDNAKLDSLNGTPVRVVRIGSQAIGFGHFMKDQFLMVNDLVMYDGKDDEPEGDQ